MEDHPMEGVDDVGEAPTGPPKGAFRPYSSGGDLAPGAARGAPDAQALPSKLTARLVDTYRRCDPSFRGPPAPAPGEAAAAAAPPPPRPASPPPLTQPSELAPGSECDNAASDLVVRAGDALGPSAGGALYTAHSLLGQGTFGQVFRCSVAPTGGAPLPPPLAAAARAGVAVKVVKAQAAYFHQARVEVGVLQFLNTRADAGDAHHVVRLLDFFVHRGHLCLAFELLGLNLYELLRANRFRGLSLPLVRVLTAQLLDALALLRDARIIHCDLKPENVLLRGGESAEVKLIDFGSACFDSRTVYSYIQSRFYRAPEVVLGHPYGQAIDVWSLGCVAAELFLGLPLFPGACEHDLLARAVGALGPPPDAVLDTARHARKFFTTEPAEGGGAGFAPGSLGALRPRRWRLRSRDEFRAATGEAAPVGKTYFRHTLLADIIGACPVRGGGDGGADGGGDGGGDGGDGGAERERRAREAFADFLLGVLDPDPATRWTPRQAALHPFISGAPFTGPFQPPADAGPAGGGAARGAPMSIPRPRPRTAPAAAPAPAAAAAAPWQAPPLVAQSPQAHAQAHLAAMAAVQAQMGAQAQAQSQAAAAAALAAHGLAQPPAAAAAAAQQQQQQLAALQQQYLHHQQWQQQQQQRQLAASFGGTTFLSPPSRSFGVHLLYGAGGGAAPALAGAPPPGPQQHGVRGLMPPMGTTPSTAGFAAPPGGVFSPGSFQPSSVRTYQSALATAVAAMQARQQQQQQQAPGGGDGGGGDVQLPSTADLAVAAAADGLPGGSGLPPAGQPAQPLQRLQGFDVKK